MASIHLNHGADGSAVGVGADRQVKDMFIDFRKMEIKSKQDTDGLAKAQADLEATLAELAEAKARAPTVSATPAYVRSASGVSSGVLDPAAKARVESLKARVRELQGQVDGLRAAIQNGENLKRDKKAQIKTWMTEFEQREGRPPTNQVRPYRVRVDLMTYVLLLRIHVV